MDAFSPSSDTRLLSAPHSLVRQWWLAAVGALVALGAGFFIIRATGHPGAARQWLLPGLAAGGWLFFRLWASLPLNHRPGDARLLATLSAATWLTIFRALLIVMLAGFVLPLPGVGQPANGQAWVPGALYLAAVAADWADGYLARRLDCETKLGEILDTETDAMGILTASAVAVTLDRVPEAYLSVGIAYYVLRLALHARRRWGRPVFPIAPWPGARLMAAFQMGFLGVVLLPVWSPAVTKTAAWVFMIPFLGGFCRDWLTSSGRLRTGMLEETVWMKRIEGIITSWLPFFLRGAGAFLAAAVFSWAIAASDLSPAECWATVGLMGFIAMVIAGILGRLAAVLTGLIAGGMVTSGSFSSNPWALGLVAWSVLVMQTGTGKWSPWHPEDRWLTQKKGTVHRPSPKTPTEARGSL